MSVSRDSSSVWERHPAPRRGRLPVTLLAVLVMLGATQGASVADGAEGSDVIELPIEAPPPAASDLRQFPPPRVLDAYRRLAIPPPGAEVLGHGQPHPAPARYPDPTVFERGIALWLNQRGQVAGSYASAPGVGSERCFLWSDGVAWDLGAPPASMVTGLNDRGQVVGITGVPDERAFVWENGTLSLLEDTEPSGALAINASGRIAGVLLGSGGLDYTACTWWRGERTDLPALEGSDGRCDATGINERGQVVGRSGTAGGMTHAVLWDHGIPIDLTPDVLYSEPVRINDRGQIIGVQILSSFGNRRGFFWDPVRGLTDLGTLGGQATIPVDINEHGQVVGWSGTANGEFNAFLWEDGVMTNLLPGEGSDESAATAINARGQIVLSVSGADHPSPVAVWENGALTYLPVTSGPGLAINERGQVMGNDDGFTQPYLWDQGTLDHLFLPGSLVNRDIETAPRATRAGGAAGVEPDASATDPGPGSAPGSFAVRGPAPGTAGGVLELAIRLGKGGDVRVSLFDAAGRQVAERAPEAMGAGTHTLRWQPRVPGAGLYFARVQTPEGTAVRRWAVVD